MLVQKPSAASQCLADYLPESSMSLMAPLLNPRHRSMTWIVTWRSISRVVDEQAGMKAISLIVIELELWSVSRGMWRHWI